MITFGEFLKERNMNEVNSEVVVVKSLGKSSPSDTEFDKMYVILFTSRKPKNGYYEGWSVDLGYETNLSLDDEDLVDVSNKEAKMFIEYYNKINNKSIKLK